MTEIERAIVQYDGSYIMPYCDLVYEALKEKQERERGCEYCCDEKMMISGHEHTGFYLAGEALTYSMQTEPDDIFEDDTFIRFCPMCGKRLEAK